MSTAVRSGHLLALFALILVPPSVSAQAISAAQDQGPNYRLAARFAPYKVRDLLHSTNVNPQWIEEGDRFWYQWESPSGTLYQLVDPAAGTKRLLFDNDRIAAELTRITRDPWDGQHLPVRNIRFIDDNTLQFEVESSQDEETETEGEVEGEQQQDQQRERARRPPPKKKFYFEYNVNTRALRHLEDYEAPDNHPRWASVSPDDQWVVYTKQCNLHVMSIEDYRRILDARRGKSGDELEEAEDSIEVNETQLTTDGEQWYCYGSYGRGEHDDETEENWEKRQPAGLSWAHDSRHFAMTRQDRRRVGELWVIHHITEGRPKLETYKYDMAGEDSVTQTELLVYDMQDREMTRIDDTPWNDQRMGVFDEPGGSGFGFFFGNNQGSSDEPPRDKWLSDSPNELYFWRRSRDQHRVDVMVADPNTGQVRTVIEERLNTYIEHQTPRRLANGDLIWWSEQDGWAHLYRYGADGTLRARLTEGPWHVDGVSGVDEDRGYVFFQANARETDEDPYYQHLYRVNLDGTSITNMTPGDFDFRTEFSESNRFFVSNFSRVNTMPTAYLHDASGRRILELETSDFSQLDGMGFQFPEPYMVKAADGVTDIYGVMYKPFDFDSTKTYPIIAYVYPGPQTESVSKSFSQNPYEVGLAQFGFIVITVGNRGGHPDRSKWYHNYGYGNLRDYGLADKKAAIEQLAARHAFIDIDRVGIYGHSGGGFMSTAAMLVYPDFFKVAVSSAGNHNNDVYNQNWSEKHDGIKEVVNDEGEVSFEYDIDRNSDLARNLKGHLLLTTGDVDNNVHPTGTIRMAQALIRANKRFDFFLFPGQRHGFGNMSDYWYWLRAEYFVKHLLGDERFDVNLAELQMESEQTGGGRATGGAR
jgi:dipeptidyl aminopeptidase/acylaminoacyl peptidase